ncbi:Phenylethanolamine N-methyltransferase [Nibea albiflora]|uniref:Phenylethanolamine N-methyltransferase n=1 Tax=Nibea albiflora TaxID=240163 RepID=A0ACB7FGN6_NIBAL|nr:Phenylethanolamine N-methyltransferase [Nibea albiflora]
MCEKAKGDGAAAMSACYQGFDPAAYLQYNYTPPRADFERQVSIVPWKLHSVCTALSLKVTSDVSGELLVDIGTGPTLYHVILTDFLEVNHQELRRWLQDEGDCGLDWMSYLQHVCKLEGRQYGDIDYNCNP